MANVLLDVYKTHGVLDNCQVYEIISKMLGIQNTYDFRHKVRGAQQTLKKKGLITNIAYATWM